MIWGVAEFVWETPKLGAFFEEGSFRQDHSFWDTVPPFFGLNRLLLGPSHVKKKNTSTFFWGGGGVVGVTTKKVSKNAVHFHFFGFKPFRGTSVAMAALTFVGAPVGPGQRTATVFGLGRHVSPAPLGAATAEKPFSTTGGGEGWEAKEWLKGKGSG